MIDNVEHDYPDTWTAEVEGNDIYSVEIELNGDEITSWDCNCPYDYGDICKHVVAVLLYIRDHKDEHFVETDNYPPLLVEILKQTHNKELSSFLSQYAAEHPDFYQELISNLHPKEKKAILHVDYAKEIQKCFKSSYNNYDFSGGRSDIARKLDKYVKKAKSLIKLNGQEEALTILLHIVKKIGDQYEEFDDYNGDVACVCQGAVGLIVGMIETGLQDELLKVLTNEISGLIKNSHYDNYNLADLNQLLFSITHKTLNYDNAIHLIDEVLKNEKNSFRTSSLVMSKIEFLENTGQKEEIEKVISFYLYLPEIRKIKLKELIAQKQYGHALSLIDEGISIAEKKEHPGTVADWKDEKLSIYKLMENREKVIELAEDLFVTGRENMEYYHILKTIIPTEKWANYLNDFLCRAGKQKRGGLNGHVLARIYIAEEYWDRLMTYVEKNIQLGKYDSLKEYEPYLELRYPERMLAFYHSQITDYAAKNMGREHYKYVVDILGKMKNYPNGTETINTLLAHFKSVYSNRRAMMEELGTFQ
jgi:tetratricopeptide (TPR) repeat protein